ncbi:MAG: hypothetical protein V4714_06045 [Bacteroidota bacterium]
MKVFPYTQVKFITPLNAHELKTIVRSYVEKVAHPAFDLYAPHTNSTFFGLVEENKFQIYRIRFTNTRPTTIVYGEWQTSHSSDSMGVELVYALNFYKKVFYFLWHALFLLMVGVLFIVPVESNWLICLPIVLLGVGNRIMIRKFEADVQFFNQFFTESIAANYQSSVSEYAAV